jgi:hypothetical protein
LIEYIPKIYKELELLKHLRFDVEKKGKNFWYWNKT